MSPPPFPLRRDTRARGCPQPRSLLLLPPPHLSSQHIRLGHNFSRVALSTYRARWHVSAIATSRPAGLPNRQLPDAGAQGETPLDQALGNKQAVAAKHLLVKGASIRNVLTWVRALPPLHPLRYFTCPLAVP